MFANILNNIQIVLSDNKYSFSNNPNFYKTDFDSLCSQSENEIIGILIVLECYEVV
jgi:hypothetical protein